MTILMFIDLIGWVGAIIILYAYFMVSTKRMDGTSMKFQALNIIGALLIFINSAYYGAMPSVMVNFFWMIIALFSVYQFTKLKESQRKGVS